jgi:NDP-sugar pyrophosphorylase family protein
LVERHLAKVEVESSNLFARSIFLISPDMIAGDLWSLPEHLPFRDFFDPESTPWSWVPKIHMALSSFGFPKADLRDIPPGFSISGDVFIGDGTKLPPFGVIHGPAWIGKDCELRPGVYIRGNVIAGEGCVLGNSCEYKNCLLLDHVQTPHFNYVGDSILGNRSHLGAGVILSNLRLDQKEVKVKIGGRQVPTGLRKLGALLGDGAEVGCNTSLQPGTILGRRAFVFPNLAYSGTLADDMMAAAKTATKTLKRP